MLWIHVVAGTLALLAGALALAARKGERAHRRGGVVFVVAMLLMTGSAVAMAAYLRPNVGNVTAGVLTAYLVLTGLLAVKPRWPQARAWHVGLLGVAIAVAAAGLSLGIAALHTPSGAIDRIPAPAYFMFGTVGLLAALGDLRLLLARAPQSPRQRLGRHLWRLGYALWIATLSAFLGQADVFPPALRSSGLLFLPVILVTGTLLYWMLRMRWARVPLPPRRRTADAGRRVASLPGAEEAA